jgi:GNAT superfamily N-acetyltransferase
MSESLNIKPPEWTPSRDLSFMARLCRCFNQRKVYEIFWEYCGLTADVLSERQARGWLYYENGELSGFALGRPRHGIDRTGQTFVFEEVWGPCDGTSNELGGLSGRDMERALQFRNVINSVDSKSPTVLRAAVDNQFAHSISRALKARWVNGLIIAERPLRKKAEFSTPTGYKLRLFEDGDQFYMSKIHEEAFREDFSPNDYKAWATKANCRTIMVTHHRKPVGFIIAEKRRCCSLGDFNIAIKPAHQGKGIGSALLNAAFNVFVDLGVKRVIADYLLLNTSAHRLYQKHNFKPKRIYNYFLYQRET